MPYYMALRLISDANNKQSGTGENVICIRTNEPAIPRESLLRLSMIVVDQTSMDHTRTEGRFHPHWPADPTSKSIEIQVDLPQPWYMNCASEDDGPAPFPPQTADPPGQ